MKLILPKLAASHIDLAPDGLLRVLPVRVLQSFYQNAVNFRLAVGSQPDPRVSCVHGPCALTNARTCRLS